MAGEHQGTPSTVFGRIIIYRAQYWNWLNYYDNPIDDPFKLYIDAYREGTMLGNRMVKEQIKLDIENMMHAMSWGEGYFIGTPGLCMEASKEPDEKGMRDLILHSYTEKDKSIKYKYYTQPSTIYDVRFNDVYSGPVTTNETVFGDILKITHSGNDPIPLKRFLEDNVDWVRSKDSEKWFEYKYTGLLKEYGISAQDANKEHGAFYTFPKTKDRYQFILKCFKEAYMVCKDALCTRYVPKAIVG